MTDRKLLEAAAKAMGYEVVPDCEAETWIVVTENGGPSFYFTPLENSGDCAAMCAKLKIDTMWFADQVECECFQKASFAAIYRQFNNDREAAWRYAATQVAAMIGGMK